MHASVARLVFKFIWLMVAVQVLDGGALSTAWAAHSCESSFAAVGVEHPLVFPRESILTATQETQIKQVLSDSTKTAEERWLKAGDLFFEARLERVPIEFRKKIRHLVGRLPLRFAKIDDFDGSTKAIVFPEEYRNTPIPAIVIAHEREHLLRTVVRSGGLEVHNNASFSYEFNPVEMYREETAAMSAEWEVARLVSTHEAAEVLRLVPNLRTAKARTVVSSFVKFKDLTRDDYLRATRSTNRYSVFNTLQKVSVSVAKGAGVPTVAGGIGVGSWYAIYRLGCGLYHLML